MRRGILPLSITEGLSWVIDELYAGALDHARLSASLDRTARLIGASGGQLYTHYYGESEMRFGAFSNIDLEALRGVDAETARPLVEMAKRFPLGHVRPISSAWPIEDMRKSGLYNDTLRKLDYMHGAAVVPVRNAEYYGVVSLNRSERAGPFSDDQLATLNALVPHFRNVLRVVNAMSEMVQARSTLAAALDSLTDGVILTDKRGRVIHLNRTAEQMLARNDGISIRVGRLAAGKPDEERALHRLIGQAAANRGTESLRRGGTCAVTRRSSPHPWLLLVTPCSELQAHAAAPRVATCTVLLRDPSWRAARGLGDLRHVYRLTPQEARVALAVSGGHGLAEAARSLGLSVLTVRNHLQRVFAKTGTSRQAELVHLIASLTM